MAVRHDFAAFVVHSATKANSSSNTSHSSRNADSGVAVGPPGAMAGQQATSASRRNCRASDRRFARRPETVRRERTPASLREIPIEFSRVLLMGSLSGV